MIEKTVICTCCPNSCEIRAKVDGLQVESCTGNRCPRGVEFACSEISAPVRILTTTVLLKKNDKTVLLPVRSQDPVPKSLQVAAVKELSQYRFEAPVEMGQVLVDDLLNKKIVIISSKEERQSVYD